MVEQDVLSMWVVTENPTDYPGQFVAREWLIFAGISATTVNHHVADTLEGVRGMLPPGLECIQRAPEDDPIIVETWL